jgi:hypothetical protein
MYIPLQNFKDEQQVDIFCPWTGEAFVYFDDNDLKNLDPETLKDAIDILPERFFKRPIPVRCSDGQVKIHVRL